MLCKQHCDILNLANKIAELPPEKRIIATILGLKRNSVTFCKYFTNISFTQTLIEHSHLFSIFNADMEKEKSCAKKKFTQQNG